MLTCAAASFSDIITPVVGVFALFFGAFATRWIPAWREKREARLELARALRNTRDPLLRAAYDLQSRFYNIVARNFLGKYLTNGDDHQREYAVDSTLWLFGQFFGWVEILRREVQYVDLGSKSRNRRMQLLLSDIAEAVAGDPSETSPRFGTFRADQRAIGEYMVTLRESGEEPRRLDCLGYGEFKTRLDALRDAARVDGVASGGDKPVLAWAERYERAMLEARADAGGETRLITVQRLLMDLVDLLDPERLRYPKLDHRGRLRSEVVEDPCQIARFLWDADADETVARWCRSSRFTARETDQDGCRHYRRRWSRRVVVVRSEESSSNGGHWVTVFAYSKPLRGAGQKRRPVDGTARGTWMRSTVNGLLAEFEWQPYTGHATVPVRACRRSATLVRRVWRAKVGVGRAVGG